MLSNWWSHRLNPSSSSCVAVHRAREAPAIQPHPRSSSQRRRCFINSAEQSLRRALHRVVLPDGCRWTGASSDVLFSEYDGSSRCERRSNPHREMCPGDTAMSSCTAYVHLCPCDQCAISRGVCLLPNSLASDGIKLKSIPVRKDRFLNFSWFLAVIGITSCYHWKSRNRIESIDSIHYRKWIKYE